jgi:hypothetical protein
MLTRKGVSARAARGKVTIFDGKGNLIASLFPIHEELVRWCFSLVPGFHLLTLSAPGVSREQKRAKLMNSNLKSHIFSKSYLANNRCAERICDM